MRNLAIKEIEIYKADIPLNEPFRIAIMDIADARNVFVKITTNDGVYGIGEASPFWKICGETQAIELAAARDLALILKGKNPLAVEERLREMEGYLTNNTTIISAFEMALFDILGKTADLPLYAILGGEKKQLVTDLTIGLGEPEYMARKAEEIVGNGFRAVKVKLGTTKDEDLARITAIRKRIGELVPIRIDANQGWDYPTAVATLRSLESMGVQYCEQPVAHWNHTAMRMIRERTTIPIMADESVFNHHDAFKLCRDDCCDYLNIKLSKSGGILNALNIVAVAESCGKRCMVGCMMESRLGLTATAHLAAARENIAFCDLDTAFMLAQDPVIGGISYKRDEVTLPDAPGLGADIDPTFLQGLESFTV